MNSRQEPLQASSNQIELVDFRLFERSADGTVYEGIYGINVSKVREILILPRLSRVPDAHEAVAGIFNLRGVQVPAVDLARWLKIEEAAPEGTRRKVIVAEFSNQTIGLIVHQASRIRRIPWNQIKPPPSLVVRKHGAAIVGTTTIADEQTLLLIDVERIVAEIQGQSAEEWLQEKVGDRPLPQHQGRILVVDDSGMARKQVILTLKKGGYETVEAADGQEAFDKLLAMKARAQTDEELLEEVLLVLSDVEMPRMDGYTLTTRLKQDERLSILPIILNSSLSGTANINRGKTAGCDEYMVKFDPEQLLKTVERLVQKDR